MKTRTDPVALTLTPEELRERLRQLISDAHAYVATADSAEQRENPALRYLNDFMTVAGALYAYPHLLEQPR